MLFFVSGSDSKYGLYATLLKLEREDFRSLTDIEDIMFAGIEKPEGFIITSINNLGINNTGE